MRYTPHTTADQEQMLRVIGADSIEELYRHIPQALRKRAHIDLAAGMTELAVRRRLAALASRNATALEWSFFLGGGTYHHFIPSAVDAVISRSEFATSYTPYQPEVSQGTLQALFEYQTLICQLTGMEISNAGVYDGASATAEAVLMSRRIQPASRRRVLISRALHPHYRAVISTYLRNLDDMQVEEVPFDAAGATDVKRLRQALDEKTMCVVVGYPNFFGIIEELAPIQAACGNSGAQLITATSEPLALGIINPPGAYGADVAIGEGQSLGIPMTLGGPGYGFFASRKKFVRNLPGRLVGETVDSQGQRGFVLTLATREQHIRREKATSNICTSQTLCTLASTVFMSLLGKNGLRRLAEVNVACAHDAHDRLADPPRLESCFSGPFFNEFVVRARDLDGLLKRCAGARIVPGIPLRQWYPELDDCLLVCVTEMNELKEIERLVETIGS
jgi:glycine dehydrogenase subunit 1